MIRNVLLAIVVVGLGIVLGGLITDKLKETDSSFSIQKEHEAIDKQMEKAPVATPPQEPPHDNRVTQHYWYCWDSGAPKPHHLGYPTTGDHYCTNYELGR
jgi:hypothetical protein